MYRIHPTEGKVRDGGGGGGAPSAASAAAAMVYTVWKKSSMGFAGTDGFSVYDGAGRLAFRVDNYSRRRKLFAGELLLMDGRGAALLALRPQILSMHDQWNCYRAADGDRCAQRCGSQQLLFSMRRCSVLQSSDAAEVYMAGGAAAQAPSFRIEGSFWRRSCKVSQGSDGEVVARISRKKAAAASVTLGADVFSLAVRPGLDGATAMAFVVVMDRIFPGPHTPLMCS